jgi:hypothetical protein
MGQSVAKRDKDALGRIKFVQAFGNGYFDQGLISWRPRTYFPLLRKVLLSLAPQKGLIAIGKEQENLEAMDYTGIALSP